MAGVLPKSATSKCMIFGRIGTWRKSLECPKRKENQKTYRLTIFSILISQIKIDKQIDKTNSKYIKKKKRKNSKLVIFAP